MKPGLAGHSRPSACFISICAAPLNASLKRFVNGKYADADDFEGRVFENTAEALFAIAEMGGLRGMDNSVEHRSRKGNRPGKKQKNTKRKLAIVTRNGELRQRTPASSSLANYGRSGSDRGTQDVRDQVC
jgi:hypothetical protein